MKYSVFSGVVVGATKTQSVLKGGCKLVENSYDDAAPVPAHCQ
jgi:hypothetical protein